jgi:UDP-N-acetylmuramyl pentapeptide phosphotransferase/UDP-N-acetylglucosamine-1-phosphate transferase
MRWLMPTLEQHAPKVDNYRGRELPLGLGLVWAFWSLGMVAATLPAGVWALFFGGSAEAGADPPAWIEPLGAFATVETFVPVFLVMGVLLFGLLDDVFGDDSKGFRGHLGQLGRGRLTTGGLKLVGILVLAAAAAGSASTAAFYVTAADPQSSVSWPGPWLLGLRWALGWIVIAGTANLLNLLDLRPGRAIKAYLALAIPAALVGSYYLWRTWPISADSGLTGAVPDVVWPFAAGVLLTVVVGPALVVWPYDAGERGVLGDAGSNAMGALAGYVLALVLAVWPLAIVAFAVVGLNLLSERVSFSDVIEGNRPLAWLDALGTQRDDPPGRGARDS